MKLGFHLMYNIPLLARNAGLCQGVWLFSHTLCEAVGGPVDWVRINMTGRALQKLDQLVGVPS